MSASEHFPRTARDIDADALDILDFEFTLTLEDVLSLKAEVWDCAYQAGAFDTLGSPANTTENPHREALERLRVSRG